VISVMEAPASKMCNIDTIASLITNLMRLRQEIINYLKTVLKSDNEQIKISSQFKLQCLSLDSVNCIQIGNISFMITKSKDNIHDLIEEDEWNELEEESNYEDEYYNGNEDKDCYEYDDEEEDEEDDEDGIGTIFYLYYQYRVKIRNQTLKMI
ncbi:MAG: hypothetical protein EZS28_046985, partial [Streblomastix strix]